MVVNLLNALICLTGSPRLISLDVVGQPVEGTTLVANKRYWGGEEGNTIFQWFLVPYFHYCHRRRHCHHRHFYAEINIPLS